MPLHGTQALSTMSTWGKSRARNVAFSTRPADSANQTATSPTVTGKALMTSRPGRQQRSSNAKAAPPGCQCWDSMPPRFHDRTSCPSWQSAFYHGGSQMDKGPSPYSVAYIEHQTHGWWLTDKSNASHTVYTGDIYCFISAASAPFELSLSQGFGDRAFKGTRPRNAKIKAKSRIFSLLLLLFSL